MKPHGIQTYRSTIPDQENKSITCTCNNTNTIEQAQMKQNQHQEEENQIKEPTILSSDSKIEQITPKRSVVSKIHIPTSSQRLHKNSNIRSQRNGIKQKDRNDLILQSLQECDLHHYNNRNNNVKPLKYLSSPELNRYYNLANKNVNGDTENRLLNQLPPRYPFGARHGSCITGYDEQNVRGVNKYQLNYSINGSRKVMNGQRDSMTSIEAGDLTPVEFDVRAISRLDENTSEKIKQMQQNKGNQQKVNKPLEINYIARNKRNVKNMSPGARQILIESKRANLRLPDVELTTNQDISDDILPLSNQNNSAKIVQSLMNAHRASPYQTSRSNATPISNVSNNLRTGSRQNNSRPTTSNSTTLTGQHRKDMDKFRKLLFSQGGRRPLTSAQKEQILGEDQKKFLRKKQRVFCTNESIEENEEEALRSKSITPDLQNIESTNIVELSGEEERARQRLNNAVLTHNQMRQLYKQYLKKKSDSDKVNENFISLKGKNEKFHRSNLQSYQNQKLKSRTTIKGKLHGNMPFSSRITKSQVKEGSRSSSTGYRQSMIIEEIKKNAASLGINSKIKKTLKIEVTGKRKDVIQPQTLGKLNRELGVIFQRHKKEKKNKRKANIGPCQSPRGDSWGKSQNITELTQQSVLKKGKRAGFIGYAHHISGMQNRWGRESLEQSAQEISTMEDFLHGGAKLQ